MAFLTVKASAFPDRSGPVEKPVLCALGLVRCQWSTSVKAFRRQVSDNPQPALAAKGTGVAVERNGTLGFGARLAGLLGNIEGRTDLLDALGAAAVR